MYRELPPTASSSRALECLWWRDPEPAVRVMPDGRVDLVFDAAAGLRVAGPDTRHWETTPEGPVVGARLRVGAAGAVLGLPASEVRDRRVALHELWGDQARRLEERLRAAPSREARLTLLEAALAGAAADPLVSETTARLAAGARIGSLAADLGVSDRQLLRRFRDAVGYGPKTLQRVLRFRAFVRLAPADDLASAAAELGFADQAHLSRECRALAGITPAQLAKPGSTDHRG